jgi:Domain of unknown function (DUF1992)
VDSRKPPGVSWESWVERQIREGIERGDFDGLPGEGQPIADIDRPRDELWWVRQKLAREQVAYLPPTLQIRKDREDALQRIDAATSEAAVRAIVDDINRRIVKVNSTELVGPPSTVAKLDLDEVLSRWRAARG